MARTKWLLVAALGLLLGCDGGGGGSDIVDCEPTSVYGPQPCSTDAECVEWEGEGYKCDLESGFTDDCSGEFFSWPMCYKPRD